MVRRFTILFWGWVHGVFEVGLKKKIGIVNFVNFGLVLILGGKL